MHKKSIIFMLHCDENTGYAISSLESTFKESALAAGIPMDRIYWTYKRVKTKKSPNILECDYNDKRTHKEISNLIKREKIKLVIAFDLGFPCPVIDTLKSSGVETIISYWGASMSSINHGLKLLLKKIECKLRKSKPDLFIFESKAMRETATHGRGIKTSQTRIIHLGVDTEKYFPKYGTELYAYKEFKIPIERKIIFYSGHMEERKGVHILMKSAIHLADKLNFKEFHFVICGNTDDQAHPYLKMLDGSVAKNYVTFAGYRNDIDLLMRSSHIGVIASTGWDSFTMSSIEMMASGLPMIVSNLQGLSETISDTINGYLIPPGDHIQLSIRIKSIIEDTEKAMEFSKNSRLRSERNFTKKIQIEKFSKLITEYIEI